MRRFLLSATVLGALVLMLGVVAASAASGYSLFGDAQLVSPGESSPHAVQATSTGTNLYGGVDFAVPAGLTVNDLSNLATDYKFTVGSCGLGSPRFSVEVNDNPNTNLFFYLGPPPSYTGCAFDTWTGSGNLASGSNLVDATQLGGGFYEPYADVQAAYGTATVSDIALVVDGPSQTAQFDNTQINSTTYTFDPTCTATGFIRDGIDMTAAQIGGNVTGNLDATGCNIGVYYDSTHTGNVTAGANISGSNYFGVFVNGDVGTVKVNVTGAAIHDIGETPLNGSQHGNAIYYRALGTGTASGTISGNTITHYQKGGITTNGKVTATITNNTVTGEGPVNYIAQNGIQVGYGAKATVTGNNVSRNAYTGANLASSAGILVVGGPCYSLPLTVGLDISKNTLTNNDVGVWLFNSAADCATATATKTNNSLKFNTITNVAVTNTTGYSATCGYQAGISDLGTKDLIVNNSISGLGYTPVSQDCTGTSHAFLRFVDAGSSARGVSSNK